MKNRIIQTALGAGVLAISLGASAQNLNIRSFADGMVFYKPTSTGVNYVALIPSGNQASDSVLLLELSQSSSGLGTSWTYAVSPALTNSTAGGPTWSLNVSGASNAANVTVAFTRYDAVGAATTHQVTNSDTSFGYSWFGGGTNSIALGGFNQTATVSGTPCFLTFAARVGTDGNLQFPSNSMTAQASITHPVFYIYASNATSASATLSAASTLTFNGTAGVDLTQLVPAGNVARTVSTVASSTVAPTNLGALVSSINRCTVPIASKLNMNTAGVLIGGGDGMTRIW